MMAARGEASGRALAKRVSPLLWLLGLCAFMPLMRACNEVQTPAQLMAGSPGFVALFAPYALALPLALATMWALKRGPGGGTAAFSLLAAAATLISPVLILWVELDERHGRFAFVRMGFEALALLAALLVLVRALVVRGWRRQAAALTAFALAALPLGVMLSYAFDDQRSSHDLQIGGWLSLFVLLALPAVTLPSLRAITRR